jgi:hypothetical protein
MATYVRCNGKGNVMRMNLKKWVGILLCCLSFAVSAQDEQAKHREVIQEFISTDFTVDRILRVMKNVLVKEGKATPESTKRTECVINSIDRKLLEKKTVEAFMRYFSASQASEILNFYKTPSGKSLIEYKVDLASGKVSSNAPPPGMSETDIRNIEKFTKETEAGRHFAEVMWKPTMEVSGYLTPIIKDLYQKCA